MRVHHLPKGVKNHRAKLTEAEVQEIRELVKVQRLDRLIAAQFGVSPKAIYDIRNNYTWTHLPEAT